jgi:hypothetical protein
MADSEVELWFWAVYLALFTCRYLTLVRLQCQHRPHCPDAHFTFRPAITPVTLYLNTGRHRWHHSKCRLKSDKLLCPEVEFHFQTTMMTQRLVGCALRTARFRPRLHWSQNRHNTTVWTDSRLGSGNQKHYCLCQRLNWNRYDWNVICPDCQAFQCSRWQTVMFLISFLSGVCPDCCVMSVLASM